jgi:hypothetical protein
VASQERRGDQPEDQGEEFETAVPGLAAVMPR